MDGKLYFHLTRINEDASIRFATAFRTTALYWLVLQAKYGMAREQRRQDPGG
ncbi:hypothetical protein [Dyella sp. AD56]|uniref:hypothetical protein n=1 Tax=Dyella sp. AD56 TaxID=1528744 RepID=UPI0013041E84|nr:hypothetical protein [Dyella sp. AD56]